MQKYEGARMKALGPRQNYLCQHRFANELSADPLSRYEQTASLPTLTDIFKELQNFAY